MNSTKYRNPGYIYALGAALTLASSFIFSKSVLNHLSMIQFGAVWFSLGVVWNSIWFFSRRKTLLLARSSSVNISGNKKKRFLVALLVAVLEGGGTGMFYLAIKAMENPAVVSFIGNAGPVLVTIMGITLLKERFGKWQLAGIVITILGVFVINFKDGAFMGFLDPGAVYVLTASFIFSLATISARHFHKDLDPDLMSFIRVVMLAFVFLLLFILKGEAISFNQAIWRDLALGSLFETLLTIVLAYLALKNIEATATSLIISSKGVWALILAWIFLGVFPTNVQLVGGLLTLIGVYLIAFRKPGQFISRK